MHADYIYFFFISDLNIIRCIIFKENDLEIIFHIYIGIKRKEKNEILNNIIYQKQFLKSYILEIYIIHKFNSKIYEYHQKCRLYK